MKRQESVTEEVTRKMRAITAQPVILMSKAERQEIAFILGQILGLLNTVPGIDKDKIDDLAVYVSQFTLKGIDG